MFFFFFLAAFLLVRRLAKSLKFTDVYPKWRSLFNVATWSLVALWILTFGLEVLPNISLGVSSYSAWHIM